jgi:hypothetical protein
MNFTVRFLLAGSSAITVGSFFREDHRDAVSYRYQLARSTARRAADCRKVSGQAG